jgi:dihydrofolate reductase
MSHTIETGTDTVFGPRMGSPTVSIVATLVVGSDGCTSINGTSAKVTSLADRENFLKRRRVVDCIIIGGNTARHEPYSKTPVPLVIISRQSHPDLPDAHIWSLDPKEAVLRAQKEFGEHILIEGGASFISYLLDQKVIEILELSITPAKGGSDIFDIKKYLALATDISEKKIEQTTFFTAHFMKRK